MPDDRTNEENRIPAVALPAGSFELSELDKALNGAVSVKDREKHPERIAEAIVKTIKNPELLANLDAPAVPTGAKLVEQDVVYVDGAEPVKTQGIAFDPAEAESGEEAAKMRYQPTDDGKVETTDEPIVTAPTGEEGTTLSEMAAERVVESTAGSSASGRTGGGRGASE